MKILYFPVHDRSYPRNRLIREALLKRGHDVVTIDRNHEAFQSSTWRDRVSAVWTLIRESRNADVVVLSELSIEYAPLTWAISRLRRCLHVVDGFVGMHETQVVDWRKYAPGSRRARRLMAQDRLAFRLADVFLVDTDVRGMLWKRDCAGGQRVPDVMTIPVGAPRWTKDLAPRLVPSGPLRLLFYGNVSPLHGLEVIIRAVAIAGRSRELEVKVIGDGPALPDAEELAARLGLTQVIEFAGRVPEQELAGLVGWSDVVLGIFGTSPKAANVIANKVWQGLASGRVVVTRTSAALAELRSIVGTALVEVAPGDAQGLADAISGLAEASRDVPPTIFEELESYVDGRLEEFVNRIEAPRASER